MAISPNQRPDGTASLKAGTSTGRTWSGTPAHDGDPTNMEGQYPPGGWGSAIFGGTLPSGTGAPGTQGASGSRGADPTNEPGQLNEGLSGLGPPDTSQTGAPGTGTTPNTEGGGSTVTFTVPGAGTSGTYQKSAVRDDLAGPRDSTQASDQGYGSGGPQLPGLAEPHAAGGAAHYQPDTAGSSHVMRGGRAVRP
jgi:hypothetical protein